jgi:1-deoxy-D-xylulose-5-phosphate reductoisomerase
MRSAFLTGHLPFLEITDTVERVMNEHDPIATDTMTVEAVLAAEEWARKRARELTG